MLRNLTALLLSGALAFAAGTTPTIDESLSMKSAAGPQISPDGRYVAYIVNQTNWEDDEFVQQIWIAVPATGERYPDVIVFWVASESDKQALIQDQASPFFTTPHFDGHPSVLVRGSRIGELTVQELAEVIQDAWLSRASPARATAWLDALKELPRGWRQAARVIAGRR